MTEAHQTPAMSRRDRADAAPLTALGRRAVGLLEETNARIDRLADLVEDLVVMVGTVIAMRADRVSDADLPVFDDGACPTCGSPRVTVPVEPDRQDVRRCARCGLSWRVQAAQGRVGGPGDVRK